MVLDIFEVKYVDIDELIDTQGIKKIEFSMELPQGRTGWYEGAEPREKYFYP